MSFFQKVEGEGAIIVEGGIYQQVELYTRDGVIYVKVGKGFARVMHDGSTSKSSGRLRLDFLSWNGKLHRTPTGSLCTGDAKGAKALAPNNEQKLLGVEV
jgi:hypothetical protein